MALYGYARVSTADQDFTLQEHALRAAGCEVIRAEKVSATRREGRTELALLLEFLRRGDTLVVTRVDRLARSIKDLQDIVHLLKERGVTLRATEQPINTQSATGKAFLDMLGVFAEFETNLRRERQQEGIAAAKARGVYRGRKPSIDPVRDTSPARGGTASARPRLRVGLGLGGPRCIARSPAVMASRKVIPVDSLVQLRQRLDRLPPKSPERAAQIAAVAQLYGVSSTTVYRALRALSKPRAAHRADRGTPRVLPLADLERYCELIAALKLRTTNKQGRHLSTQRAIEILEQYGVETSQGLLRAPPGVLHKSTINLYLGQWHLDHPRLTRQPPAVRFEAEQSNACWQFDMSPSDLKHIETPDWIDPRKGEPTLMLFSVVDDRSGVSYMEYRCVYGEDAESALRFLFNAMAPKADPAFPFQGRPQLLYLDNGPVAKSRVFQTVMLALGIAWQTHVPAGKDGTRVTARAKGKVERPFRTVKEAHETLYHFHKPATEAQANEWLFRYLLRYNAQPHRSQDHARLADWLANLPPEGLREMCTWEQFCRFAREPERRKVGVDARVTVAGTAYEVDPQLAGEVVLLLWGLFDDALYVEYEGERSGPYSPVSGPIPLHRYRAFKRGKREERADRIRQVADATHAAAGGPGGGRPPAAATDHAAGSPHATLRCGRLGVSFPHAGGGQARHCRGVGPAVNEALAGGPGVHRPGRGGHADASSRPPADPGPLSCDTVRRRPCGLTSCSIMGSRSR